MKIYLIVFTALLFLIFQVQPVQSQDEKVTHTFKITGEKLVPVSPFSAKLRSVEYDSNGPV